MKKVLMLGGSLYQAYAIKEIVHSVSFFIGELA